jgi:hypothetical protein
MTQRNSPLSAGLSVSVWLAAQVAALAIAAARVPLWARSPAAGEQLALAIMLATQIATASLLFPSLFQSKKLLVIAIATAWPLGELASFLADASKAQWAAGEAYVTLWIVGLHLWARAINQARIHTLLMVCFSALSLGGPLLVYLHADFGESSPLPHWPTAQWFGPIMGAVALAGAGKASSVIWIAPALLFGAGLALRITNIRKNRTIAARASIARS